MRSPTEWPEAKRRLLAQQYRLAEPDRRPLSGWGLAGIVALSLLGAWVVAEMAKVLA